MGDLCEKTSDFICRDVHPNKANIPYSGQTSRGMCTLEIVPAHKAMWIFTDFCINYKIFTFGGAILTCEIFHRKKGIYGFYGQADQEAFR